MSIKKYKPTTSTLRHTVKLLNENSNSRKIKKFCETIKLSGGRNNTGRITSRGKGGGVKRKYRIIDFKRSKIDVVARVLSIDYDPNRNCKIATLIYKDGTFSYIIAPVGLKINSNIVSSKFADITAGNSKIISDIPIGTILHNAELYPGSGGKIARSAGTFVQLMAKEENFALLRLPSGELRKVSLLCRATIGQVGNIEFEQIRLGKAGTSKHMGHKPKVRGVAMNPVDHPHGGGEGRTSGGRHPVTPWGLPTRGFKTRNNKFTDKFIVKHRK